MVCIILGAILTLLGLGLNLYGSYKSLFVMNWLTFLFNRGVFGPGLMMEKIGKILVVVGVLLLIVGLKTRSSGTARRNSDDDDFDDLDDDLD